MNCDVCGIPLTADDQGQQTADTCVCEPCCRRLIIRAMEAREAAAARERWEAEGKKPRPAGGP